MTSRCSLLLLCTLVLSPTLALADGDGMLLPGWAPVAEQALGDIRAAASRLQPDASADGGNVKPGSAAPVIEAFLAAQGASAGEREANARVDELTAPLWRASAAQAGGKGNGADRVAQAFTVGNAAAQLASAVYGGPPGAAAYAAWWAFQQPGASAQQALAVGVLAGSSLWASQNDASGQGVPSRVSQQTSLAAALGGLAVAAAGGDEQALRGLFFDAGAAVLVHDGTGVYCLSGTVQCQRPPAKAAVSEGGRLQGWALDQMQPVAMSGDAPTAAPAPAGAPSVAQPAGALPLGQGWTLAWALPASIDAGQFRPSIALTRGGATTTVTASAPPAATPAVAVDGLRYDCKKGADTRAVWVVPGEPGSGSVCKTFYQVDQTRAVLWNAKQNPEACQAKAKAQVSREQARGYKCAVGGP